MRNSDTECFDIIAEAQEYLDAAVVNEDPITDPNGVPYGLAVTHYTGASQFWSSGVTDASVHVHEVIHRRQRLVETEQQYYTYSIVIADEDAASYWQGRCG
ncbi:MAG: hypothetical protein ACYC5V_07420 [Gemmatimonadaceae bacterium]